MNYTQRVCELISEELPDQPEFLIRLYALLAMTTGTETTLENVHDAWSLWRTDDRPEHSSIVPFIKLSYEVQELDRPYTEAIRRVAAKLEE